MEGNAVRGPIVSVAGDGWQYRLAGLPLSEVRAMDESENLRARIFAQRSTAGAAATALLALVFIRWGITAQPYPHFANLFMSVGAALAMVGSLALFLTAFRAWGCVRRKAVWVFEGETSDFDPGAIRPGLSNYFLVSRIGGVYRAEVWMPACFLASSGKRSWYRARPVRVALGDYDFVGERRMTREERRELLGHVFAMCLSSLWMPAIGAYIFWLSGLGDTLAAGVLVVMLLLSAASVCLKALFFAVDCARGRCSRRFGSDTVRLPFSDAPWITSGSPASWRERAKWTLDPPLYLVVRFTDRLTRDAFDHRVRRS